MAFDWQSILHIFQQKTSQRAALITVAAVAFFTLLYVLLTSEESRYDYVYDLIEEHYADYEPDEDTPEDFDPLEAIRAEIQPDDLPVLTKLISAPEEKITEAALLLIADFGQTAVTPLLSLHQIILARHNANVTATFHNALLHAAKDDLPSLTTTIETNIQQHDNYLITTYQRCQSLPQDLPEMVFPIESMAQAHFMEQGLPIPVAPDAIKKAIAQLKEEMLPAKLKVYEDKDSSKLDTFLGKAPKNLVIVPQKIEDKCNNIINDDKYLQWADLLGILKTEIKDIAFITGYCNTTQLHTLHRDIAVLLGNHICRLPTPQNVEKTEEPAEESAADVEKY